MLMKFFVVRKSLPASAGLLIFVLYLTSPLRVRSAAQEQDENPPDIVAAMKQMQQMAALRNEMVKIVNDVSTQVKAGVNLNETQSATKAQMDDLIERLTTLEPIMIGGLQMIRPQMIACCGGQGAAKLKDPTVALVYVKKQHAFAAYRNVTPRTDFYCIKPITNPDNQRAGVYSRGNKADIEAVYREAENFIKNPVTAL
jgi:hypothetical protein